MPLKELVEGAEQSLRGGGAYPLPAAYLKFFTPKPQALQSVADKLEFHAIRTADYIMGQCG
jgi:hypothetical protein